MGSPATEPFLDALAGPLMRLNQEIPLRLRIISRGRRSFGALDEIVDRVDWQADTFGSQLADADAGLMPLPDTQFTRGKCAYKLLQYGAAALPVIGSPVGVNRNVLGQLGGLSASNADEWESAIRSLFASTSAERRGMGEQARFGVDRGFSFRAWAPQWAAAVRL
ncbi:glycosyltransferase [Arthrobacter cryoconiti]|uniref:Glycosyltransferase n=1 Tax=Arthrobacter cryoconiti TaxID=748907 RepID=A0ABV8QWQ9_9MICC|nr:glycosyltransferase [Arthrobacter cryoconiti]MCC9069029.1 glycosyltransferase [Arthrobacter cryoconiti]